jgi:hypothetical protein
MTIFGSVLIAGAGAIESWSLAGLPLTGEEIFDRTGDGIWGTFETIGLPLLGISFFLSALSLGFRYRRATGTERQELKWLLLGGAFTLVIMFTASPAAPWDLQAAVPLLSTLSLFALAAIPLAVGVAITRYHLYDIDVVINRTLVYLALTGILTTAYLGIVVLLQQTVGTFAADSDLAIAGSTLAVAALFRPARSRVQAFIDQRFYRRKYDAQATLEAFAGQLRDEVELTALSHSLVTTVGGAMQPSHASLWLRPSSVQTVEVGPR